MCLNIILLGDYSSATPRNNLLQRIYRYLSYSEAVLSYTYHCIVEYGLVLLTGNTGEKDDVVDCLNELQLHYTLDDEGVEQSLIRGLC